MFSNVMKILMLIAGIWAIVTGKMPSLLPGETDYRLEGRNARVLGLMLVLPLLTSFVFIPLLLRTFRGLPIEPLVWLDLIMMVCGVAAVIISFSFRQLAIPVGTNSKTVHEELSTAKDSSNIEATR